MSENSAIPSIRWRLLLALAAGFTVAIITILSQWSADGSQYSWPMRSTESQLWSAHRQIESYHKEHGQLPDRLADMDPEFDDYCMDGWRRPLRYVPHDQTYELYSLGRDGKPGGKGIDAEMKMRGEQLVITQPTLCQFLFEIPTTRALSTGSTAAGFFTFLIVLLPALRPASKQEPWNTLLLRLIVTIAACTLVAGLMAALDIPSGH